jgi:hypothetical protein
MKMTLSHSRKTNPQHERGTAVVAVLALIAILLVYVSVNLRTLDHLGRELTLLEQKQQQRLRSVTASTNVVSVNSTNLSSFNSTNSVTNLAKLNGIALPTNH